MNTRERISPIDRCDGRGNKSATAQLGFSLRDEVSGWGPPGKAEYSRSPHQIRLFYSRGRGRRVRCGAVRCGEDGRWDSGTND
eukprot:CAMPEP_0196134814 /NCGR_PEP_ID=MMETSP0910-20130528/3636_1 /TAXON_ID=49265 /ORGANISM="Thalassiosira rotula, Strain GSO102" /LENGTH=82 /DNA_ID=CAMNT_0041394843 /DNA_START=662 /DNA_END=907 /DNA_ORIENTATION=+